MRTGPATQRAAGSSAGDKSFVQDSRRGYSALQLSAGSGGGGEARAESHHAGLAPGANTGLQVFVREEYLNYIFQNVQNLIVRPPCLPLYRPRVARCRVRTFHSWVTAARVQSVSASYKTGCITNTRVNKSLWTEWSHGQPV